MSDVTTKIDKKGEVSLLMRKKGKGKIQKGDRRCSG